MEYCLNFTTETRPLIKLSTAHRGSDVGERGFTQALKHSLTRSISISSGAAVMLELRQSNAVGTRLSMGRSTAAHREVVRELGGMSFSTTVSGSRVVKATTHTSNFVKALRNVSSTDCEGG